MTERRKRKERKKERFMDSKKVTKIENPQT